MYFQALMYSDPCGQAHSEDFNEWLSIPPAPIQTCTTSRNWAATTFLSGQKAGQPQLSLKM